MYMGDDTGYFAHASSIAFFQFPSMDKELSPNYASFLGSSLLAAPFVFFFSLIDRATGSSIVYERTLDNVVGSWSQFGFVVSSICYFWLSCFLIYRCLTFYYNDRYSILVVLLMVLIQGIPLYAYRRPVFSHVYEFFLQSLMVYLAVYFNAGSYQGKRHTAWVLAIALILGMMCLVRPNNAFIALAWPFAIFGLPVNRESITRLSIMLMLFFMTITLFLIIPDIRSDGSTTFYILERGLMYLKGSKNIISRFFELHRHIRVLFGTGFGLVYTSPFLIFSVIAFFCFQTKYRKFLIIPVIPLLFNYVYFVIARHSYGSWYGYRYILFSAIPLFVLPFGELLKRLEKKYGKSLYFLVGFVAFFPLLSMLCFEGNPDDLTLRLSERWGGWQNPQYQIAVWKTLLFDPVEFFKAIFKGGPLYVVYMISMAIGKQHILPEIVFSKYPTFEYHVLIKSLIIYVLPFLLYFIFNKKRSLVCFEASCNG